MSFAAQGAYLKLLCYMWKDSRDQCSIADNDELIARGLGTSVDTWMRFRSEIQNESDPILASENGCLVSRRLQAEASKQRKYRKLQALKGTLSAQRRSNRGSTAVQPEHQPDANSSSSSSSTSTHRNPYSPLARGRASPAFDRFWAEYPRKVGKPAAQSAWKRHRCDEIAEAVLAGLAGWKGCDQWRRDGGNYIPHPATWLNRRGWEDPVTVETRALPLEDDGNAAFLNSHRNLPPPKPVTAEEQREQIARFLATRKAGGR